MKTNVYKIIWADDDIDSLRRDPDYKEILEEENVIILGDGARTSSELKDELDMYGDMVDAIITDGNYDEKRLSGFSDRTTSGLTETQRYVQELNKKRFVPAFLYTGKGDMLNDKFPDGELDYFIKKGRYFEKGKFPQLIKKLKSDVDFVNSPEFRIYNKYAQEFAAAKLIDGATENLQRGLLYLYEEDSWKNVQDYFNPARKIVERMMSKCEDMRILPPGTSLNNASRYFSGIDKFIGFNDEIMPKPLAESLFYFLRITQDGSHDAVGMSLGVDQYVRENKNINLYRSILYIAMDLLLWFEKMYKQYSNNNQPLWKDKYIYKGKVCCNQYGSFFTDKFELQKSNDLKDGAVVKIYSSICHRFPKGLITDYVNNGDYIIEN